MLAGGGLKLPPSGTGGGVLGWGGLTSLAPPNKGPKSKGLAKFIGGSACQLLGRGWGMSK